MLNIANGNRPADVYAGDAAFGGLRQLVDANPQLRQKTLGKTDLVPYLDADGHKKYAVVYYPPDFATGKPLPTMEGQATLVLKRADKWLIEAYRYTIKPAAPGQTNPGAPGKRPGGL